MGRPLPCDLVGLWWFLAAGEGISGDPGQAWHLPQGQVSSDGVRRRRHCTQERTLGESHPQTPSKTGQSEVRL